MSKRELKPPVIPKELVLVGDARSILEESAEQEYEIVNRLFENIFLTKIHAVHLEFKQTVFKGCRFIGCDFSETSFVNVQFVDCDFSNSNLSDTYFKCCSFHKCKAVGADFYGSRINHVTFFECNFCETGFDATHISFVKMENADFTDAGFSKSRFAVSAKYCYAAHESRLHQNDRCKRFALCLVLTVRFRSLAPWGKLFQLFI